MSKWGSSAWGASAWGGAPSSSTLSLLATLAVRENRIRLSFTQAIYFSTILDDDDGSKISKYSVVPVAGSRGLDDTPARTVNVIDVQLPTLADGIPSQADYGRMVDLYLDRPMTPHAALYDVTCTNIFSTDLSLGPLTATIRTPAVHAELQVPSLETAIPTRDLANPQTASMLDASLANLGNADVLGTYRVSDSGDYAYDEGLVNFKKRVFRRLMTKKGAFAHLPNYGVGIPQLGKKLATSTLITALAADAEKQIALEPETAKVRVIPIQDRSTPGLLILRVLVQPKHGTDQKFDVPVPLK